MKRRVSNVGAKAVKILREVDRMKNGEPMHATRDEAYHDKKIREGRKR